MRSWGLTALLFVTASTAAGCTEGGGSRLRDAGALCDPSIGCRGREVLTCNGGALEASGEICETLCVAGVGCQLCIAGATFCRDNAVHRCDSTGQGSTVVSTCGASQACYSGTCISACEAAANDLSNIGCEYWAVDLDNEVGGSFGGDAAAEQFAVVLANPSDVEVTVLVEQNDAPVGSPAPGESLVGSWTVAPQSLTRIDLPQREVDCSSSTNRAGVGTCVTGNAYKITTNYPVVAYQFNPIVQSYSNDASLLIPTTGLDRHYRVLGWPTANPISVGPVIEGIPDHSFVTIVATRANTTVEVRLGGPIVGNGDIPAANAGETITYTLQEYEVLNLESRDVPGDLTGTVVTSDKPVSVFSGGERGLAPFSTEGMTPPPGGFITDFCCTEHLEEQVFPTVSWGKDFVITRSPVRSSTAWREPDIYRLMADKPNTTVTTNLPAPYDAFSLGQNEWVEFPAHDGFVLQADQPVSIEQILVSDGFIPSTKPGHGGDPSMTLFPPHEQHRESYVFLVPDTFSADYIVVSMVQGTSALLDGTSITATEFSSICTYEDVGVLNGELYVAATCPISPGTHTLRSGLPVGLMVYGYYGVGSYAFAGGSNVTRINVL